MFSLQDDTDLVFTLSLYAPLTCLMISVDTVDTRYHMDLSLKHVKRALNNFSLIPRFFFQKVEISIPLEVCTYICSNCMLNLTCNFNSVSKIYEFFFQPFLKIDFLKWLPLSRLLNLAPSSIILVWRKILKLVCTVLWIDTKINWTLCILWHFALE